MAKKIVWLVFIFGLVLALYYPVLNTYFISDDFFHFKVSLTNGDFMSFVRFFGVFPFAEKGYAFYRPLFREALYSLSYTFWGLNQVPLRIFSILLHFVNIVLVYNLIEKIIGNRKVAFFSSLMFAVSTANVGILYYLAGGIQAQGATMFVLLTLLLFSKHKILAFVTFLLSLMSHEIAVVTPAIICGLMFLNKSFKIKYVLPYFLAAFVFLFVEFKIIGFSTTEVQYALNFDPRKIANTLMWYGLWSYGLPETVLDYIGPGFHINPNLMRFYGNYYKFIIPSFAISLVALVAAIRPWAFKFDRKIMFLAFWFVVGISTVLLLPMHKSTYYLSLSLPAFWALVFYLIFRNKKILVLPILVFLISLAIFTFFTVRVGSVTYWAAERGIVSKKLITELRNKYPNLPKGAVLYIKNDTTYPFISKDWGGTSKQASLVLSGSDAIELLYNDPTIQVYYEDLHGASGEQKQKIFEFEARIL